MKDWIEFPKKILNGEDVTFQPLRMTVNGAGGTGKSFVIKVL